MQDDAVFLFRYWGFVPLSQDQKQRLDLDLSLYVGLGENKKQQYLSNVKFDEGHLGFGSWDFYLGKGMCRVVGGGRNSSWPSNDRK